MTGRSALVPWLGVQGGGILLGLAFAFDGAGWLAWPGMWLVAARLDERSAWERVGDGSLAGVWCAGLAAGPWLFDAAHVHLTGGPTSALVVTVLAIAFYGGAWLAAFTLLWSWLPAPRWLAGPALWVLLELLRSGGPIGMPWALLGHSQHGWPALAQLAELGGVPLVSLVVAMPGLALADRSGERRRGLVAATLVVVVAAGFGTMRLHAWSSVAETGVRVRGVSGGHLAADRSIAYPAATADGPAADLVVWPAHAMVGYVQDDPVALLATLAAARRYGPLVLGIGFREASETGPRYFDSALLLDDGGAIRGRYDKRRLAPFVDRAPLELPELTPDPVTAGTTRGVPLRVAGLQIGPLLGWEGLFPELARWWAHAGVDLLVNLAGDEDLGDGARQLARFSTFRSIEVRRWMLRVSGVGWTTVVDPAGRSRRTDGVEIAAGAVRPVTWYVRAPWMVPAGVVALLAVLLIRPAIRSTRR